jgi:microcystin degradation protein MlrC
MDSPEAPVFLSDSGDNTTAGGAGDSPFVLQRLIALGATGALVAGITDPEAVKACFEAGEGRAVDLVIGGRLDSTFSKPFPTRARVKRLVRDAGTDGPRALAEIQGVEVVLQSGRAAFTQLADFERMGIDPAGKRIVVVKLGYLFPELRDYAPRSIMALSPGFADQRMDRLPFRRLSRPIYPLDPETAWKRPDRGV